MNNSFITHTSACALSCRRSLTMIILSMFFLSLSAQTYQHDYSKRYIPPTDQQVIEKLDQWRDCKFGFLIHWGLYSVPGVCESWPICSEDASWIPRDSTLDYVEYKKNYFDYAKVFNPTGFAPEEWAQMATDAGMRYVVFTTKHHEGFNMFDTKESDFSITKGPFKDDPRADVTQEVFKAFRAKALMIGAYFSKPDWHSPYYWWPRYATPTRRENYKREQHPEQWRRFKEFSYNQIEELMSGYGDVDILWLDGGWTGFYEEGNTIHMDSIARMARRHQPGLIIVDRAIAGPHENYLTPEQRIPQEQINVPWESCLSLGRDWGYVTDNEFKSSAEIIHTLVEVVAKGGALLLGAGPDGEGLFPEIVKQRLQEIGTWVKRHDASIYGSRTLPHYQSDNTWFVQDKEEQTIYATYCVKEDDSLGRFIEWEGNTPPQGAVMRLLSTGKPVKWRLVNGKVRVLLPTALVKNPTAAFVLEYPKK